jgi:mono/diheme cytochrome c family protein
VTPYKALQLGVQINMDALDAATQHALADQLRADPSGRTSAMLSDPKMLVTLVNANAVIGMPAKDSMASRGRDVFRTAGCSGCHNVDQGRPVPTFIVPMKRIFPGDNRSHLRSACRRSIR